MIPPLPDVRRSFGQEMVLVILVGLGARLLVLVIFNWRGLSFPFVDAAGYVDHARWLAAGGGFLVPMEYGGRFFHGLPLLVAMAGKFTGEFLWTGVSLNLFLALGACALFHFNFNRLSWSLVHAVALPGWLSTTSTLHSEAGTWFFCLVGLCALREPESKIRRYLLLIVSGYAMVCRPTAFLILLPMFLLSWHGRGTIFSSRKIWLEGLLLGAFPLLMALTSGWQTGLVITQSQYQEMEYAAWAERLGSEFPTSVFTWPGASLWAMTQADTIRAEVKIVNLCHVVLWLGCLCWSGRLLYQNQSDWIARLCLIGLTLNGAFILVIGGPFGGSQFYRFLATQANAFVVITAMRVPFISRWFVVLGCAASVLLASMIARQA